MKAFKVVYQHGHFIDKSTNKRIIPIQGEEYIITAEPASFTTNDGKLTLEEPLNSEEKAIWVKQEYGEGNYGKILSRGQQLFFRVGNSKRIKGDESQQYIFGCILLEDLYLYLSKHKKGDDEEDWRLTNCVCVLDSCLLGGLSLTQKIPAKSLNQLFSLTVMFYFSMQRSGSANAFDTFYIYKPGTKLYFDDATYHRSNGLKKEREKFVQNRNKLK